MRTILSFLLLCLLVVAANEANAFRFSPFRAKFDPSGSGANQLFLVENNTDEPASVQISVMTREVDENGNETNKDAEKDFTIYPAQMVLEPHTQKSVRVQWMGDANLRQEKAYRIIAEQLPVNLDKNEPKRSAVKFLINYRGALFVTPSGLKQDVALDSFKAVETGGKKMLELVFNNSGTQHALLQNLELDFGGVKIAGDDKLQGVVGEGILAGHKRKFLMPWPANVSTMPEKIGFTYDKQAF